MALKDLLAKPLRSLGKLVAKKDIKTRDKDQHNVLSSTSVLSPAPSTRAWKSAGGDFGISIERWVGRVIVDMRDRLDSSLMTALTKVQDEPISATLSRASTTPYPVVARDHDTPDITSHIHDLPPELLHEVLRELCEDAQSKRCLIPRYFELFNFAQVCKRWHDCAFEVYRERLRLVDVPESRILALWKEALVFA